MKVLGIDPGTRNVGYALLSQGASGGIKCLTSGTLKLGEAEVLDRLLHLQELLTKLILELKPDHIAFESLIYVKSPTALIKLAMAKGVMLGVAGNQYKGKIFEYKPNLVKQIVTGNGHADKQAMQKMIQLLIGVDHFSTFDESDAISVALCHLLLSESKISCAQPVFSATKKGKRSNSLAASLSHRIKTLD